MEQHYSDEDSLNFINEPGNAVLEWLRMPGDLVFILGGVVPFVWIAWLGVRYRIRGTTQEVPMETLFVEAQPVPAFGADEVPESGYGTGYRTRGTEEDGGNRPIGGA